MSTLSYDVFVSDGVPRVTELRMPDGSGIVSSPVSSTLIYGERDAVLADPSWTVAQTEALGDWIERSGKRLAYIYVTHGHGDHWFGTAQMLERFPGATVYATEGTIRKMHQQADSRPDFWDKIFPGLIGDTSVLAQPIPAGGFELEGNQLHAIEVGHTDTDDTTVLHVPSIGLVVAGDVAYNGVHLMLLEIGGTGLKSWLDAIDQVAALHPAAVVAGHKNKDLPDDPAILDQTRQYLLDAQRLLGQRPSPREFFDQMVVKYPDRLNRGPLWYSALGLLG
jgi:glyoxylase-like metal-dependent hydrolase (beta-lactamase superfamily II)